MSLNYKYSAFPFRGKLNWPNDAKIALILTLNLEYWDMIKDMSIGKVYADNELIYENGTFLPT